MDNDFEIKRLLIGLSTLTLSPSSSSLISSVQSRFKEFMDAIVFLCQKSLQLREKKSQKLEQAEEDKDCEKGAIYDEDEDAEGEIEFCDNDEEDDDWNIEDDDDDKELYETKLDKIDDVLFVQEQLNSLQTQNPTHFNNILSLLSQEQQQGLMHFFN